MNQFVESLYRLYKTYKIDIKQVERLIVSNKINKQEYEYIISAKNER
jgi:hypothetical protein